MPPAAERSASSREPSFPSFTTPGNQPKGALPPNWSTPRG
jgi:hypothetical protein